LTRALREKRTAMVDELLARGADPTKSGAYDLTPLHFVTQQLNLPLMQKFLDAGAAVDAKNTTGTTPLLSLIDGGYFFIHGKKILPAVELLLRHGADPNLTCVIQKPMLAYAEKQSPELGRLLKRFGARK